MCVGRLNFPRHVAHTCSLSPVTCRPTLPARHTPFPILQKPISASSLPPKTHCIASCHIVFLRFLYFYISGQLHHFVTLSFILHVFLNILRTYIFYDFKRIFYFFSLVYTSVLSPDPHTCPPTSDTCINNTYILFVIPFYYNTIHQGEACFEVLSLCFHTPQKKLGGEPRASPARPKQQL